MGEKTKIQWADMTFSPWRICTPVSAGCANCYAAALAKRYGWGEYKRGVPRIRASDALWKKVYKWNALAGKGMFVECGVCGNREFRDWDKTLPPGGLACCSNKDCISLPETESNSVRPRAFPSLCDPFDMEVETPWLIDYLRVIKDTPNIDHLLLTKRPGLWRRRLELALKWCQTPVVNDAAMEEFIESWLCGVAPQNVWVLASTENQDMAYKRVPELLEIPALIHGLSIEPLIGPVNLYSVERNLGEKIDWIIIGGESGPGARECQMMWVQDLIKQGQAMGIKVFTKQLGANCRISTGEPINFKDPKGGDINEWIPSLRVREFPELKEKNAT